MTQDSGIYAICGPNGRRYIGSTLSFTKRRRAHFRALRAGLHHSRALQRAFDKYGEQAFTFEVLRRGIAPHELLQHEQMHFDKNPGRRLYNSCRVAGNCLGIVHTPETRAKLSALRKGRVVSPETCAKIAAVKTGLTYDAATRAKISQSLRRVLTGRPKSSNTSGYCGVNKHSQVDKWSARVRINGVRYHVGLFDTPEAAASAIEKFKQDRSDNDATTP